MHRHRTAQLRAALNDQGCEVALIDPDRLVLGVASRGGSIATAASRRPICAIGLRA